MKTGAASFLTPALCARASNNTTLPTNSPVIDLGYTKYQGFFDSTSQTTQFLGMRYAAPPTGSLRWREPQPPATTQGIQTASAQPNQCFAALFGLSSVNPIVTSTRSNNASSKRDETPVTTFSEDCLFLNVWVPGVLGQKKNLPVIVWIHGFGSASGLHVAGLEQTFDGDDLVRKSGGNVVVVVIQYRLGVFGFLAGQKIKSDGILNAGLLDQQFAFRWVQDHISKFGGNPNRVTIWDESAGAGSVVQHIVANGGQTTPPLFRGAMTSSTFMPPQYKYNDRVLETFYSEVISLAGCSGNSNPLGCLRNVDPTVLEAVNNNITTAGFFGTPSFAPVFDGSFIKDRPTELLKKGRVNGLGLLSVTNAFERTLFVNQMAGLDAGQYAAQLFPNFGPKEVAGITAQYAFIPSVPDQISAIIGESIFICPTYYLMRAFPERSFKGEFAIPPALHGDDVQYYFPAGATPAFNNSEFIDAFALSFLNFAMAELLDPNVKEDPKTITPHWTAWDGSAEMLFNKTDAGAPVVRPVKTDNGLLRRCSFWESVAPLTAQ